MNIFLSKQLTNKQAGQYCSLSLKIKFKQKISILLKHNSARGSEQAFQNARLTTERIWRFPLKTHQRQILWENKGKILAKKEHLEFKN